MLPIMLLACGSSDDAQECANGFELRQDGLCYEGQDDLVTPGEPSTPSKNPTTNTEPDSFELADLLSGCDQQGVVGDGRIDFENLCADEVCLGDVFDGVEAAWGSSDCVDYLDDGYRLCNWNSGIETVFEYAISGDVVLRTMEITDPYEGTSATGIGVGSRPSCLVDEMPEPVYFTVFEDIPAYLAYAVVWPQVAAYDRDLDNHLEEIFLYDFN